MWLIVGVIVGWIAARRRREEISQGLARAVGPLQVSQSIWLEEGESQHLLNTRIVLAERECRSMLRETCVRLGHPGAVITTGHQVHALVEMPHASAWARTTLTDTRETA